MSNRSWTVIGAVLLGGALVVIGGYLFLEHVVLYGTHGIIADYPGFEVHGHEDGWDWSYDLVVVTSPTKADLHVQLGNQPVVDIGDLTPAMVSQFRKERGGWAVVDPDQGVVLGAKTQIDFRGGVVANAQFGSDDRIVLFHRKERVAFPMSQRELEQVFGVPSSTTRHSDWR